MIISQLERHRARKGISALRILKAAIGNSKKYNPTDL